MNASYQHSLSTQPSDEYILLAHSSLNKLNTSSPLGSPLNVDAKKEKHKTDRDTRALQADMAKVEKDHQQAIESLRRVEGISMTIIACRQYANCDASHVAYALAVWQIYYGTISLTISHPTNTFF